MYVFPHQTKRYELPLWDCSCKNRWKSNSWLDVFTYEAQCKYFSSFLKVACDNLPHYKVPLVPMTWIRLDAFQLSRDFFIRHITAQRTSVGLMFGSVWIFLLDLVDPCASSTSGGVQQQQRTLRGISRWRVMRRCKRQLLTPRRLQMVLTQITPRLFSRLLG